MPKHQQRPQPGLMCADVGFEFLKPPLDELAQHCRPAAKLAWNIKIAQFIFVYFAFTAA